MWSDESLSRLEGSPWDSVHWDSLGGTHRGRELGVGDWGQRTWLPEVGCCNPGAQTFGFSPSCCFWCFSVPSLPNTLACD